MTVLYYFVGIIKVENIFVLLSLLFGLIVFAGIIISKLAIEPLIEYTQNLQNLSKETLHELNLPISTIMTNVHMLKKNLANEKDLKRVSRVESACQMLQQRYNELDYLIKIQSSGIKYEYIALDALVKERVDFLAQLFVHVEFHLSLAPTKIYNDKVGLSKVIDNLIDNAVKYSSNIHKVEIELQNFTLLIKDHGCGISEVELLKIFDDYYQSNRNIKGFGIGLKMAKRFCDENSILLKIRSNPGLGTTVILKFKEN